MVCGRQNRKSTVSWILLIFLIFFLMCPKGMTVQGEKRAFPYSENAFFACLQAGVESSRMGRDTERQLLQNEKSQIHRWIPFCATNTYYTSMKMRVEAIEPCLLAGVSLLLTIIIYIFSMDGKK